MGTEIPPQSVPYVVAGFAVLFAAGLGYVLWAFRGDMVGKIECPVEVDSYRLDVTLVVMRGKGKVPEVKLRRDVKNASTIAVVPAEHVGKLADMLENAIVDDINVVLGAYEVITASRGGIPGVCFVTFEETDSGTRTIDAFLTREQAEQMAEWLRIAAAPGRTLAEARRRMQEASK